MWLCESKRHRGLLVEVVRANHITVVFRYTRQVGHCHRDEQRIERNRFMADYRRVTPAKGARGCR